MAILCVSGLSRAACTKDTECKGDDFCEAGQCSAPVPATPPSGSTQAAPEPASARPSVRFFDGDQKKPRSVEKRIKHPGLLAAGIATGAAGMIVVFYGLLATQCEPGASDIRTFDCSGTDRRRARYELVSLGLVAVAVPLIVIGARREPVPRVAFAVGPWISPQRAGLQLQLRL